MSCNHCIVFAIEGDTRPFCNKCGLIPSDPVSVQSYIWDMMVRDWIENPIVTRAP